MHDALQTIVNETGNGKFIPGDGATGSMLEKIGVTAPYPALDSKGREALVRTARAYAEAGARIITAGNWRAKETDIALEDPAERKRVALAATNEAIAAAMEGVKDFPNVAVLASVSPVGDCYRYDEFPDRQLGQIHYRNLDIIKRTGASGVAFETFTSAREAKIVADIARDLGLPHVITWVTRGIGGILLDGTPIAKAVHAAANELTVAVGINCSSPEHTLAAVKKLRPAYDGIITVVPNGPEFRGDDVGPGASHHAAGKSDRNAHVTSTLNLLAAGANWVGGCCGMLDTHIADVVRAIKEYPDRKAIKQWIAAEKEFTRHATHEIREPCCPHSAPAVPQARVLGK